MKITSFLLAAISAIVLCAGVVNASQAGRIRPEGAIVTREFDLGAFDSIVIGGNVNVTFRQSDGHSVSVRTHENLFDLLDISVHNGVLGFDARAQFSGAASFGVIVYAPSLTAATFSGMVTASGWDVISGDSFNITLSGGTVAAAVNVNVQNLYANTSGATSLSLSGNTNAFELWASGASSINALGLEVAQADLHTSGASSADVLATDRARVSVSGSSSMRLSGTAQVLSARVSGASRLDSSNLAATDVSVDVSGTATATVYASERLRINESRMANVFYLGDPPMISRPEPPEPTQNQGYQSDSDIINYLSQLGIIPPNAVIPEGDRITQEFELEAFDSIDISSSVDVTFRQSDSHRIVVRTYENVFDILEFNVHNNTLNFGRMPDTSLTRLNPTETTRRAIELFVYAPSLSSAKLLGSIDAFGWDTISGDSFELKVEGSINAELTFDVQSLTVDFLGSVDLSLSGTAQVLNADISGVGWFNASNLTVEESNISSSGMVIVSTSR